MSPVFILCVRARLVIELEVIQELSLTFLVITFEAIDFQLELMVF